MNFPSLKLVSILFMFTLMAWSLAWIVFALRRLQRTTNNKLYWQTHIIWSLVNVVIASYSLLVTVQLSIFSAERAISLRNIVAVNIVLDIFYIMFAQLLIKSTNTNKNDIGRAIVIQASFLLMLDTAIIFAFMIIMS